MRTEKHNKIVWLYVGDHTRHPFINLALNSLVKAGYQVTIIDLAPKKAKAPYRHVPAIFPVPYPLRSGRSLSMWLTALWSLCWQRPGVIITTIPMAAVIGRLGAAITGSRLIYYPFELYGEQGFPVSAFWQKMEKRVLAARIDALITQNEERARIYLEERGSRVTPVIVHNYKKGWIVSQPEKLRDALEVRPDRRIVLYEGILLNEGRNLDCLIRSAAFLPEDVLLVLMGEKKPSWIQIEPLLREPGISGKVMVAPAVPANEVIEYAADADAGVIIYADRPRNNYYCEPGKLSDYILAGVPVVAPDFPTIGPVVREYGIGEVFKNAAPEEIARAINAILSVPKEKWRPALEKASRVLVWETQVPALLRAVTG
jgi:glycosyltransferase involved in cell wall biosynthesis